MKDSVISAGRFLMHRLREAVLYPHLADPGKRPRVAFLPPDGRRMSSLLRGYNIAHEMRKTGWNAVVVPKQLELAQRQRFLRLFRPDLAVLLGSRLPDNSARLLAGIPYVYDLDDADFHNEQITDRIRTDVACASGVTAGSGYVADWCRQHNQNTIVVWTGSQEIPADWPDHRHRQPIITWAQSAPFGYPAEFEFVLGLIENLAAKRSDFSFRLYGCPPDSEEQPEIRRLRGLGIDVELRPMMKYDAFLASLREVAVGLSPIIAADPFSRGKSFGKILGYLGAGVPVIASDEADHARFFTRDTGVVTNDPAVWSQEIEALLDDPERRNRMAQRAHADFNDKLTTRAAADQVARFCRAILMEDQSGGPVDQ